MRILIVAHDFPPLNSSASRRPYSWARTWSRLGHEVHVLTTAKYATDGRADLELDCTGFSVHAVSYLPFARPLGGASRESIAAAGTSTAFELLRRSTRRLRLGMGFFTQTQTLAMPALLRRARELGRFDFVISTSGPEVCTFVAHAIAGGGTPWIADYRDLWLQEFAIQRYAFTTWATGMLNRRMLRRASAAVTVSQGLAEYLRSVVRCPVWVRYNGFLDEVHASVQPHRWNDGKLHMVYTGNFYPEKRDPDPVLRALASLPAAARSRLAVDVFGPDEAWVRERIARHGLQNVVRMHGPVPYRESLAMQKGADALLFVDWMDSRAEGVLTGKLFEYLASGRPLLCVGIRGNTEAAQIIRDCGAGEVAVDGKSIRAALQAVAARTFTARPDGQRIGRFSREAQARALLEQIETLLRAG